MPYTSTIFLLYPCLLLSLKDTDEARSSKESEESMLADLRWLGLDWDEGPDKEGEVRLERYLDGRRSFIPNK